jgi:hypothetical protein
MATGTPWSWANENAVETSRAFATESTASGRAPSYRGFWVSFTVSYVAEPGRARVPSTCAARRRQSAAVGGWTEVEVVPLGWTGGAGVSGGGEASWGVHAWTTSARPAAATRAPARTGRRPSPLFTARG